VWVSKSSAPSPSPSCLARPLHPSMPDASLHQLRLLRLPRIYLRQIPKVCEIPSAAHFTR
jgi:hypothetical protein